MLVQKYLKCNLRLLTPSLTGLCKCSVQENTRLNVLFTAANQCTFKLILKKKLVKKLVSKAIALTS